MLHTPPLCVIETVAEPMRIEPLRACAEALAATLKSTWPFPEPVEAEENVIQVAPLVAVQSQLEIT